jgi:DnaD/phage-associated family protein
MAVFRKVKKSDFTVIDNNIFKNEKLTLKAKGMICTMLSLPDDWQFNEEGLAQLSNDSRSGIRNTLNELMEYGYLTRKQLKNDTGKFANMEYTIYEEPLYQKPTAEKPTSEKEHNKILINKELNNKNITTTPIYEILEQNGFTLSPIHYEIINEWEDNELTRYAIKQAVLNNKYNIKYIDKILYSYKKDNITTVQQALEREEEHQNKVDLYYQNKYKTRETRYEREQRIMKEWLEKDD